MYYYIAMENYMAYKCEPKLRLLDHDVYEVSLYSEENVGKFMYELFSLLLLQQTVQVHLCLVI